MTLDDRYDPKHPRHRELMLPCCATGQHKAPRRHTERRAQWLHMARSTNQHIETEMGTLCPLCFEFTGHAVALGLTPAEQACYNCNEDPLTHCRCHKVDFGQ